MKALATLSLRGRLLGMLWATILFVLAGEIVVSLSGEVASLDARAAQDGTILAQAVAAGCAEVLDGSDPHRFDDVVAEVRRRIDLVELLVVSRDGVVVGGTEPARLGRRAPTADAFVRARPSAGLAALAAGYTEHRATMPILRGKLAVGTVDLRFRSTEVHDRAVRMIAVALAVGSFWMLAGAAVGTVYVRKITRPLASLTEAARALGEDRLDDVTLGEPGAGDEVGVLEAAFARLVSALRAQRDENRAILDGLEARVAAVTSSLAEAKGYLESVLRCIDEGILTVDVGGRVVQANPGAHRIFDGLGAALGGALLSDLLPEAAGADPSTARTLEVARPPRDATATTGERALVFRLYPLRGPDAAPMGLVVTVVDVTQQRSVEAQLRRHDRLISLGTIAAGLAHEMGNYMHAINGYSALVLRGLDETHPLRADVAAIHDENARAVALLERFLQFARPASVRFHAEPLDELVREALAMASYALRKGGIAVVDALGLGETTVVVDGQLLKQVFVNLVLNAVDAMSDTPDKKLTLRSRALDGDTVEVIVSDTGTGIEPAHLDHVFDPFFTTKAATGTGLGLSIAHQIVVTQHRGALTVRSTRGRGASFSVVLPARGPGSAP